jgi:hypothetical protein
MSVEVIADLIRVVESE